MAFRKLCSLSGHSESGRDCFRCAVLDSILPILRQSADPWWWPPRGWRNERLHHLTVQRRRRRGLGHKGLTPIRSRFSIWSSVPHRGSSSVWRSDRSDILLGLGDWPLPDLNDPVLLRLSPLRSSGPLPFRSSFATGRPKASSMLAGSCSQWRILHKCYFTKDLVEGSGWRPGRTPIENPPGCSTWRNHLLDFC